MSNGMTPCFIPNLPVMVLLAIVYLIAGKLGLLLAFVNPSATAVWAPTGIALAATLMFGYRVWPGVMVGAFLVNVTTTGSIVTSLGIAAGNTLEGLAGAYLVTRFAHGRYAFERPKDIFKFALLAGILSTMVAATVGVTSLALVGFANWTDYGSIWFTWWLGDAMGAFMVAPLLVLWFRNPRIQWQRSRALEVGLLLVCLVVVGQVVFGGWIPATAKDYPLDYLCVPLLMWAAFRFGQRETATAALVLSGIALWGTLRGFGPFVRDTQNESLLLLQTFLGITALLAMAFAAVVSERRQVEAKREELLGDLQEALARIKILRGLLPICGGCKKIRNDQGCWDHVETYIRMHSEAAFTHTVCPDCLDRLYPRYANASH